MKLGTNETCLICTQVQDILQLSTIQWFSALFQEQLMLCVCMYNVMKMVPKFLTLHTQNPDWSELFKQLFQREDFVSIQKELRFLDSLIQGNNFSSELLGARNNFTSHWAASDQFLIQNVLVSSGWLKFLEMISVVSNICLVALVSRKPNFYSTRHGGGAGTGNIWIFSRNLSYPRFYWMYPWDPWWMAMLT